MFENKQLTEGRKKLEQVEITMHRHMPMVVDKIIKCIMNKEKHWEKFAMKLLDKYLPDRKINVNMNKDMGESGDLLNALRNRGKI